MKIKFFLAASAATLSIAGGLAAPAYAQETSSAVRGVVDSPDGPIAGATVTIVHEPSGTTLNTKTASDGTFAGNGLRVGGPYTVTVAAPGYSGATVGDLFLQAGQPVRLPITVEQQNEIVVSADSLKPQVGLTDGPTTALGREQINAVASINRDIRDLARRDPLVTMDLTNSRAIEIAGNNGRLNRFSVDGMQMSDDFGLNNGGLPTNRGPVPYDAIEQFTVKVAPFDIAEADMQGGAINVVLRSGSNQFHGGGFFTYTDAGLTGKRSRDSRVNLDFDSKQFGGTLAGPIIKDKLFFMVSYERTEEGQPLESGIGDGFANQVPGLNQGLIDQVSNIAQSRYGYDTLGLISTTNEKDEKFVGKLDWNISDKHRASLTYIRNVGSNQFQQNTFLTAPAALGLQSNGYQLNEEVNSGTLEVNSTWSSKFSTTIRASYRDYNRAQTPFGARGPQFEVCTDAVSAGSATSCGGSRVFFGPDPSRHANALNTENLSIDFTARLQAGDHSFRYIVGYTKIDTFNLFLQNSLGNYYFDSLADFQSGTLSRLRYANAVPSNDANDAAASFSTTNWSFGIQDDWQVTDKLAVSAGIRYDLYGNDKAPILNRNFLARTGFSNRTTFNGLDVIQPRASFSYTATDRLVFRGGIGIFAGGTPDVFLSNIFSNTGQLTNAVDITRANCATSGATCGAFNNVSNGTIPQSVINYLTTNTGSLAAAPTDVIDPDLKLARKMKVSLSADYQADLGPLGDNWLFGVSFMYDKTLQGYMWQDVRSVVIGTLPDGRPKYGPLGGATTNRDLMLTNTTDGRGLFGTFRFEKRWDLGLTINGSYTRSDVKDRSSLTSSTSSSNYGNNAFYDANLPAYGRSIYEFRDQWKMGMNFDHAFFGDNKTTIGIFGEYRSGRPFSATMLDRGQGRSSVFGTVGNLGGQLLYVPAAGGDTRVVFDSAATETAFNAMVTQLGLEKYRGKVVNKNSLTSPDVFRLDLHFGQELPLPVVPGGKFELFADVENVLNIIDKDWGSIRQVEFPYNAALVTVTCQTSVGPNCTQYQYSRVTQPQEILQTRQSLYGIRIGARVKF